MKIEIEADEGVLRSFANPGVYRVTILEHLRQSIREALPEETVTVEIPKWVVGRVCKGEIFHADVIAALVDAFSKAQP